MKKIIFLTSIGTGLEYYDFVVYALMAEFISKLFFSSTDHFIGLMITFSIFAIGYFARPLGGILFGIAGDKIGRKKAFSSAMLIMAFATFMIGATPVFKEHSLFSASLFLIWRVIQGVSYGAEIPVSLTFLIEHSNANVRGKNCGWMISSIGVGVVFGSLLLFMLTHFLSNDAMLSWGWRIPFLLGGVLAIPGYFIRKNIQETPCFVKPIQEKKVLHILFTTYLKNIFVGFGVMIFLACLVILFLSFPSYLHSNLGYRLSDVYLVITIGYMWSSILIPTLGRFSDYIGRKKLLSMTAIIFLCSATFLFNLPSYKTFFTLLLFILAIQTIIAALSACCLAMLAESFPATIRCTGVALCYNGAYVIAALMPTVFTYILKTTHQHIYMVFLLMGVALFTLLSAHYVNGLHNGLYDSDYSQKNT